MSYELEAYRRKMCEGEESRKSESGDIEDHKGLGP
jgi:hypothetical protein